MTDKIIIALDYDNRADALKLVENLSGAISFYKVGLELYASAGPEIIRELKAKGLKVFLDLKFFDIPNTVAKASRAAVSLGVDIFNLHLLAGPEVLIAAKEATREEAARKSRPAPKILGVTILTSSSGAEWQSLGLNYEVPGLVMRLTERAKDAGLDGVVASAQDAKVIKERFGKDFLVVSPGIRSCNEGDRVRHSSPLLRAKADDQKRTFSAQEAFTAGSDYIVVGRPVTRAPDPKKACLELLK
ncbi:MAG: orotidine-5'-phosphate decarboxylase [Candidatus Ratteibacteria bacterium]|jgi:orotidine-5'-phosphate decarboxylase